MSNVLVNKDKIDILANAISIKSGEPLKLTIDEMVEAVDGIETGGGSAEPNLQAKTYTVDSAGTETVTADSGYDGLSEVEVSVPTGSIAISTTGNFITINGTTYFRFLADAGVESDNEMGTEGYISDHTIVTGYNDYAIVPSGTSVTPTESAQTIGAARRVMEGAITVNAIPSNYVGSGITQRSSTDLTASGATVTVPSGYYSAQASKTVPSASVVDEDHTSEFYNDGNTRKWRTRYWADYGSGGFIDGVQYGSYMTRSAVSANTTITPTTSSQTIGGTNYMMEGAVTVSAMPTGTAGTPTATKGSVSNHSVSVTPSVTNTTGYITGSTKTGTAVTVSASELVSGSQTITSNQTVDATNLAEVVVNVASGSSKNTQVVQSTTRTNASALTAIGSELTVSTTGTYDIYYSCFRTNTSASYTWATRLYINGTAYGTAENTTWTNNQQNTHLSNISLTAGDKLRVYGRNTRGTSYYVCCPTLVIVEA